MTALETVCAIELRNITKRFGSVVANDGINLALNRGEILSLLGESTALMTVACLVAGLAWGAAVVCMPFVTRTEWGMANMASNMAVVNTYSIFGAVLGSWGAGLLAERLGSFIPVLVIMAFMGAAGTLVALALAKSSR